jgi:uroporphyrinogen decarboxylase
MSNNCEWIRKTLAHCQGMPTPFNFDFSPPARAAVESHYGAGPIEERLDFPIRMTGPSTIKPLYASPDVYGPNLKDEFGVTWTTNRLDRGAPVGPCLPEPSLAGYIFPDPDASYRYAEIGEWCRRHQSSFRVIWVGDLWERATFMRGMEGILTDLLLEPRFVRALLRGLADYILETMRILFDRFQFEAVAISDDYGTQRSLVMSPQTWREVIKPLLKEIYDYAKSNGRVVFHHSCGNVESIMRDFLEIGLDILHPIQPEAMDILKLKAEFGADLTFCGGLGTQDLLPHASPAVVRESTRKLAQEMGKGGGYILEPGITLQADVPLDNLVAMIDEARAWGSQRVKVKPG